VTDKLTAALDALAEHIATDPNVITEDLPGRLPPYLRRPIEQGLADGSITELEPGIYRTTNGTVMVDPARFRRPRN
jgi:hypothetical protein